MGKAVEQMTTTTSVTKGTTHELYDVFKGGQDPGLGKVRSKPSIQVSKRKRRTTKLRGGKLEDP